MYKLSVIYVCKQELALNNLEELLCHKTQPTNQRPVDWFKEGNYFALVFAYLDKAWTYQSSLDLKNHSQILVIWLRNNSKWCR